MIARPEAARCFANWLAVSRPICVGLRLPTIASCGSAREPASPSTKSVSGASSIECKYEDRHATDPWYIHLYRKSYAYHGVHPFYMWYWGAHALDYLGDVIVVGGDPKTCERLGYRAASSFRDALEMAGETVGRSPSISYFHVPPLAIADVR